jgi:hypothetical protein
LKTFEGVLQGKLQVTSLNLTFATTRQQCHYCIKKKILISKPLKKSISRDNSLEPKKWLEDSKWLPGERKVLENLLLTFFMSLLKILL